MASLRTMVGLFLSGMGVIFSLSSFAFFFYGNYNAAVWALVSGLLAGIDFHLLFLHMRRTLGNWHTSSTISDLEILGVGGIVGGLSATVWFIFMFLYYNLPILPVPESYQIAAVWSFMAAKWGLGLLLTSRHLAAELRDNYPDLLPSPSYYRSPHYYARLAA